MKMRTCDCCGKDHQMLYRVVYLGMDTDVCGECRGDEEAEPEYEHEDWLQKTADKIDGYDRDDLGESPDY